MTEESGDVTPPIWPPTAEQARAIRDWIDEQLRARPEPPLPDEDEDSDES